MQQDVDAGEEETRTFSPTTEEEATATPTATTKKGEEETVSGTSLWDTLAGWSSTSAAKGLISQQQEQITDLLYPKSYGPSADWLDIDESYYGAY